MFVCFYPYTYGSTSILIWHTLHHFLCRYSTMVLCLLNAHSTYVLCNVRVRIWLDQVSLTRCVPSIQHEHKRYKRLLQQHARAHSRSDKLKMEKIPRRIGVRTYTVSRIHKFVTNSILEPVWVSVWLVQQLKRLQQSLTFSRASLKKKQYPGP